MNEEFQFDEWVAGFFDAEGCIDVRIDKSYSQEIPYNMCSRARISQSYLSGFVDGDGAIKLDVGKQQTYFTGFRQRPVVDMEQTNTHIIDIVELFCNQNKIENRRVNVERKRGNRDDSVKLTVYKFKSVKKFLNMLRPFLLNKKIQAEIMVEEIIPRLEDSLHLEKEGFLEIMAWKEVMDSFKGGTRGKYDLAYFEDLWEMKLPEGKKPDVDINRPDLEGYRSESNAKPVDCW